MPPSPLRLVDDDFESAALRAIEHKHNVTAQLMGLPVKTFESELRRRYIQGQIEIDEFELGLDMLYGLRKPEDADES